MTPSPDFPCAPDLAGLDYISVLQQLHLQLRPRSYLEIGTQSGTTLALAQCASIAVDPQFALTRDVVGAKPACLLFQLSSDDFFAAQDPVRLFGRPVDMAFLDGMHWFEFLLRDFMHTERHCKPNSVVVLHDCLPVDPYVARRNQADMTLHSLSRHPHWWAGDAWKAVLVLKKYRPDLVIRVLDAVPTGLVVVTGLDPASTVLAANYFRIVEEFRELDFASYGPSRFHSEMQAMPAMDFIRPDALPSWLWL